MAKTKTFNPADPFPPYPPPEPSSFEELKANLDERGVYKGGCRLSHYQVSVLSDKPLDEDDISAAISELAGANVWVEETDENGGEL